MRTGRASDNASVIVLIPMNEQAHNQANQAQSPAPQEQQPDEARSEYIEAVIRQEREGLARQQQPALSAEDEAMIEQKQARARSQFCEAMFPQARS